jgi:hypothetical protein
MAHSRPNRPDIDRHGPDWVYAGGVFLAALIARLLFLYSSPDRAWPHSIFYEGDAPEWVNYAAALDRGVPYEFDLPLRSPAVAYLLHWLDPGMIEGPFTIFKVLWCAFAALACALAYLAFRREFDRSTSLIGAGLCTFSFGLYVTATSLNNEALYLPTLCGIVLATLELIRQPRIWSALVLAALHGLATLIRPEHTLLLLLMLAYTAWRWTKEPSRGLGPTPAVTLVSIVLFGSTAVCVPWSIHGSLAAHRLNQRDLAPIDYAESPVSWSDDARAFLDSLPAFARGDNFQFVSFIAQQNGARQVTAEIARQILIDEFGSIPEPLRTWTFVSSQGPLSFALANHPKAQGGFSKAALIHPRFGSDPRLNLTMPSHLHLYNHGYSVGWRYIRTDFTGWLRSVRQKLSHSSDGVTLGFTSRNWPIGCSSIRRPIDIATPAPENTIGRIALMIWRLGVFALIGLGMLMAMQRRAGGPWLVIIAYKIIITIAFYGYARQAVSILPAFYVFMALPIAAIVKLATARRPWRSPARSHVTAISLLIALVMVDAVLTATAVRLRPEGPIRLADKWGPNAFESYEPIRLRTIRSSD